MPLYEYECDACGHRFEVIQKFSDAPADACGSCGKGPVRRLLSSPAIQFKGSGWYITDYAQKGKSDGAKSDGASAGKPDTAAPSDKSESKTEKKDSSAPAATPPAKA